MMMDSKRKNMENVGMSTLPPGHALVCAKPEREGPNDAVTCEIRGKGKDVMLCAARIIQGMASHAGVPTIIMALDLARIAEKVTVHTSIDLGAIQQARADSSPPGGDLSPRK